jgi:hypothetical protein
MDAGSKDVWPQQEPASLRGVASGLLGVLRPTRPAPSKETTGEGAIPSRLREYCQWTCGLTIGNGMVIDQAEVHQAL